MAPREHLPPARLEGQVALVTGAGRGLGRAIALALGEAGAAVAVCVRSQDDVTAVAGEIVGRGGQALALRCDVTERQEVEGMVAAAGEVIGPVDLLVHNAARSARPARLRPPIPTSGGRPSRSMCVGRCIARGRSCRGCSPGAVGGSSTSAAAPV